MKEIIRFIKRLFGCYETEVEYLVNLKDIIIPDCYKKSRIREAKWNHKMNYWLSTGDFESKILLHRNFLLYDGYSSVKIAYLKGIEKVPVYFVD